MHGVAFPADQHAAACIVHAYNPHSSSDCVHAAYPLEDTRVRCRTRMFSRWAKFGATGKPPDAPAWPRDIGIPTKFNSSISERKDRRRSCCCKYSTSRNIESQIAAAKRGLDAFSRWAKKMT